MPIKQTVFPNGVDTFVGNSNFTEYATSPTLVVAAVGATGALGDSGKPAIMTATGLTVTLPAIGTAGGQVFTVVNGVGNCNLNVSPGANDAISWAGDNTDNRDVYQLASESKKWDYITVAAIGTATADGAYAVTDIRGLWRKATA